MNVAAFLRWVLMKPLVIVVVLGCALVGAVVGYRSATVQYETQAAVLVIPPAIQSEPGTPGASDAMLNPFTNLSGSTTQLAWVLASSAQSLQARELVEQAGASSSYTIASVAGGTGFSQLSPQITITVPANDPQAAKAGAAALISYMRAQLRSIQKDAGVTPNVYADLRTTTEPREGVQVSNTAMSNAGGLALGAALAGLLASLLVAAGLDARRRRRTVAEAEAPVTNPLDGLASAVRTRVVETTSAPAAAVALSPEAPAAPSAPAAAADVPTRAVHLEIARPPAEIVEEIARPAAPRPVRPLGSAHQRAMTRWRDHVEAISEASEFPLPAFDDDGDTRRVGTSG